MLVENQNTHKTSKKESLEAIDTLKKYCTEQDATGNVQVMLNKLEYGLVAMRMDSVNDQSSCNEVI